MTATSNDRMRELHLQQMEERLAQFGAIEMRTPPREGWIRAIRKALGMRSIQLAQRLRIKPSAVTALEQREAKGSITLDALSRAAEAMDCELVYAVVPRTTLSNHRERQARRTAEALTQDISHSMGLEAQGVEADKTDRLTERLAADLLRSWTSKIWDAGPREG